MDREIEDVIIKSFFTKLKAARAPYALSAEKKRRSFIWDFSLETFKQDKCFLIKQSVSSSETIYEILKEKGAPDSCYVISIDSETDGKIMNLSKALLQEVGFGPVLISCIHGKLAYFEAEQCYGAPDRYLLINQ